MKPSIGSIVREDLRHGFYMLTWWYPLNKKWRVELKDPLGNTADFLDTIREDCVKRNQDRMRLRSERWFPENTWEERRLGVGV